MRAEAEAVAEGNTLADRFEVLNGQTLTEIARLREDMATAHLVEAAERERADAHYTLH
jgi:hypothetical protein